MFTRKMSAFLVGSGSSRVVPSKDSDASYCPLTPEEAVWDADPSKDHGLQDPAPCFPLTPEELYLESCPPILADINSCFSLEEMNLCCPNDQTLRELNLCSPVTPDHLSSPRTPGDVSFSSSSSSPQTAEISLSPSGIPSVASPSNISFGSSLLKSCLEHIKTSGDISSPQKSEDSNQSPRCSQSHTINVHSPYPQITDSGSATSLSDDSESENSTRLAETSFTFKELPLMSKELSFKTKELSSTTKELPFSSNESSFTSDFISLSHTDLFVPSSQHQLLMPSRRVDPTSTSTPYTDAAQARKPARQGHIKRPMNAFMIWAQQQRHQIIAQYPGSDNAKISKFLGSAWKKMEDQEKMPYREEADRLKLLHVKEFPEYKYKPRKAAKRKSKQTAEDEESHIKRIHPQTAAKEVKEEEEEEEEEEEASDFEVIQSTNNSVKQRRARKKKTLTACTKTGARNSARRSRNLKTSHNAIKSDSPEASENQDSSCRSTSPRAVLAGQSKAAENLGTSDRFSTAVSGNQVKAGGQKQVTASDGFRFRTAQSSSGDGVLSSTELTFLSRHGFKHHSYPSTTTSTSITTSDYNNNTNNYTATTITNNNNNDDRPHAIDPGNISGPIREDSAFAPPAFLTTKHKAATPGSKRPHKPPCTSMKTPPMIPGCSQQQALGVTSRAPMSPEPQKALGIARPEARCCDISGRDQAFMGVNNHQTPRGGALSQDVRSCSTTSEDLVSDGVASSSSSASPSSSSSCLSTSSSSSQVAELQEFAFSEDELDQLFSTTADEGAFINLVKYVMC